MATLLASLWEAVFGRPLGVRLNGERNVDGKRFCGIPLSVLFALGLPGGPLLAWSNYRKKSAKSRLQDNTKSRVTSPTRSIGSANRTEEVWSAQIEWVERLAEESKGADFTLDPLAKDLLNVHPLYSSAASGDMKKMKRLLARYGQDFMSKPGLDGHNILHHVILAMNPARLPDSDRQNYLDILNWILSDPTMTSRLVNAPVEKTSRFAGMTPAFIAVLNKDLEVLQLLVSHGADVEKPRVTGTYFQPQGDLYYGDSVISFSVCARNLAIVKFLVDKCDVDLNTADSYGNTPLHLLAWHGMTETEDDLGDPWRYCVQAGANPRKRNKERLTPLLIAVARRHTDMVRMLIDEGRVELWSYGENVCYMYPLIDLDTKHPERSIARQPPNALELIVANEDHKMISSIPLFSIILEVKWAKYAYALFMTFFSQAFLYVSLLSIAIWLLPHDATLTPAAVAEKRRNYFDGSTVGIVRLVLESALALTNLNRLIAGFTELQSLGWQRFFLVGLDVSLSVWLNISLFAAAVACRFTNQVIAENAVLGFASIVGWLFLLIYTKGVKTLGPLALVLVRVVSVDVLRFTLVACVFVIGFAEAIFLQLAPYGEFSSIAEAAAQASNSVNTFTGLPAQTDDVGKTSWNSLGQSILYILRWLFGLANYDDMRMSPTPALAVLFFYVYMFAVMIVLLNILIAMLTNTFSKISDESEQLWLIQWAELIMRVTHYLTPQQRGVLSTGVGFRLDDGELPFDLPAECRPQLWHSEARKAHLARRKRRETLQRRHTYRTDAMDSTEGYLGSYEDGAPDVPVDVPQRRVTLRSEPEAVLRTRTPASERSDKGNLFGSDAPRTKEGNSILDDPRLLAKLQGTSSAPSSMRLYPGPSRRFTQRSDDLFDPRYHTPSSLKEFHWGTDSPQPRDGNTSNNDEPRSSNGMPERSGRPSGAASEHLDIHKLDILGNPHGTRYLLLDFKRGSNKPFSATTSLKAAEDIGDTIINRQQQRLTSQWKLTVPGAARWKKQAEVALEDREDVVVDEEQPAIKSDKVDASAAVSYAVPTRIQASAPAITLQPPISILSNWNTGVWAARMKRDKNRNRRDDTLHLEEEEEERLYALQQLEVLEEEEEAQLEDEPNDDSGKPVGPVSSVGPGVDAPK
ncbi:hypothetical protein BJ742DRAFT_787897 [Cladochytrium replicatum]|nr:hypothetical protein BJ742DRAFT_787897 [Cladochytrium replicatum]